MRLCLSNGSGYSLDVYTYEEISDPKIGVVSFIFLLRTNKMRNKKIKIREYQKASRSNYYNSTNYNSTLILPIAFVEILKQFGLQDIFWHLNGVGT